jgi:hypothetical protein
LPSQESKPVKQEEEIYKFSGFSDRDIAFRYIKRVWVKSSPFANEDDESDSDEDEWDEGIVGHPE